MKSSLPAPRRIGAIEVAVVVAAALVLFLLRFGLRVLDPGEVDWLLARDDPAAYYLVWDTFRYEAWSFPLGRVTGYLYPLGTSLPLADGLPLLAYPAKLLSPMLPPVFQFFGLWHLISAVLQAYFGYRIVRRFVSHSAGRLLGSLLFLLAPVFLYREGHIALSGHWVILAAMDLYLDGDRGGWRSVTRRWCALGAVTALVHPYLLAMVMLFYAGLVLRLERSERWPWYGRVVSLGIVGATLLVTWWIAGNFEGLTTDRVRAEGFGHFSLNLNGLINPMGFGTLLPAMPRGRGQYEGFAYLGAGWILITAVGIVCLAFWRDARASLRPHRALVWIVVATYAYALSNVVMWNETIVLQYLRLPIFDLPTGVYRCSGRFVWPVVYAGMTVLVVLLGRLRPRGIVIVLMSVALVLQVWDLRPLVFQKRQFASLAFRSRLQDPNWSAAAAASTGITTIPPFKFSLIQKSDYRDICWLARQHRIPTTAGYAARMSPAATILADSMRTAIANGTADFTHLYICDRASFPAVYAGLGGRDLAAIWDGYYVCYNRQWGIAAAPDFTAARSTTFAEFLAARRGRILLMAARDEATSGLTAADRQALRDMGVTDTAFTYRGAIAAIVDHGQVAWQRTDAKGRIEFALAVGDTVGSFRSTHAVDIMSAGFETGNEAQLRLDGAEEGFNGRGFNILVLDDDQRLIEVAWFDTFAKSRGFVVEVAERGQPRRP